MLWRLLQPFSITSIPRSTFIRTFPALTFRLASTSPSHSMYHRFLSRFSNGKAPHEKGYYKEICIIFTVFAITGSSSMKLVRYAIDSSIGKGSLTEGPNSWRAAYIASSLPVYSIILLTLGTLSGRGKFFRGMLTKMYSRFIPSRFLKSVQLNKST